ncbi:MAG TPA: ABC transporter permease [Candidatus Angelobacter sp.]|nr:ABC transporter permease [Candidatus Angelobacter sp.]
MRAALVIALKDLRQRVRNRTAIVVAVIAPFGLAAIFSLLLGGVSGTDLDLHYAIADLDGSEISAALRDGPLTGIEEAGIAEVSEVDDADAARAAVEDGDADAAVIVPEGFAQAITSGGAVELEIIGDTDAGFATGILDSLVSSYLAELDGIRLSVATAAGTGVSPADIPELVERASATRDPIDIADVAVESRRMGQTTYFAASMAIFFLFFTAQFGVLSLLAERREGTLPRLVAAPIRPWSIVLGKALGTFALGFGAMVVLAAASTLLIGADWGSPIGVVLLISAAVFAAMGITAFIATLARTEEQAGGWNAIVAVTLAILGGSFFDLTQGPEILRQVSRVTPHAWFLEGVATLNAASATLVDIALPLAALLGIGLVTGAIGLARARGLVMGR